MNGILETITNCMAASFWAAPLLALVAGIITSFTPCSLATVPMLLTCVGASKASPGKAFRLSLAMAAGMAVTFGVFGSVASAIGHHMHETGHWWAVLMGILMVLMALQVFGMVNVIPHIHFDEHTMKRGYAGAFLTGALGGLFASHCAIPVMVALLALVARLGKSTGWGILLMVLYALGHSILLIAAGTSYSYVEKMMENPKYDTWSKRIRYVLGTVILFVGFVLIFGEK